MSMIGYTLLNEIVVNRNILSPVDIFLTLNDELNLIFSRNQFSIEDVDEGMDITIAVYNTDNNMVEIASAMQNFFIVKNGKVDVYKGDIFSIGGYISRMKMPVYNSHFFIAEKGMRLFMSSDGLIDQFGKEMNDKFGVDRFENLLANTSNLDINRQFEEISKVFDEWKGSQEQLDDILIMGIEF